MALQIWLPLDGSSRNLGLNTTATYNLSNITYPDGEFGIAGSFANGAATITGLTGIYRDNCTVAFWCKSYETNNWGQILSFVSPSRNWNFYCAPGNRFKWEYKPARSYYWTSGTGNTYHHVCFVSSSNAAQCKFFYDGTLIGTGVEDEVGLHELFSQLTFVQQSFSAIKDFRVYNHQLSNKEVKKLARGLVCHYPFDDGTVEQATNLITSLSSGGQTTIVEDGRTIKTSGTNADTYFSLNLSETIVSGTTYTLSCDCDLPAGTTWSFPLGAQTNSTLTMTLRPGHNVYTFTANNITWRTQQIFMDDLSGSARGSGVSCYMRNWVLTKTDHEVGFIGFGQTQSGNTLFDKSGYGKNATISGTKRIDRVNSSPRYKAFMHIENCSITHPTHMTRGNLQQWTVMCWIKPSVLQSCTLTNWNNSNHIFYGSNKSLLYLNAGVDDYYVYGPQDAIPLNQWTHIAFVFNNTTGLRRIFINGVLRSVDGSGPNKTSTPSGIQTTTTLLSNFKGDVVDYREYMTALSPVDVQELYNTSMDIDSAGNVNPRILTT